MMLRGWSWISIAFTAKGYTVMWWTFMVGKLTATCRNQQVLAAAACLGNVAEVVMLWHRSRDGGGSGPRGSVGGCPSGADRPPGDSYTFVHDVSRKPYS